MSQTPRVLHAIRFPVRWGDSVTVWTDHATARPARVPDCARERFGDP